LSQYDLEIARVRFVYHENNTTFCVWDADGGKYALRICRPKTEGHDVLAAEVKVVDALSRTAVGAAAVVRTRTGRRVSRASADGVPEARSCVLFHWLRGSTLSERITAATCQQWGTLAATMHRESRQLRVALPEMDDVYDGIPEVLFDPAHRPVVGEDLARGLRRLRDRTRRILRRLDDRTIIHGDLHPWNVKVDRGRLRPFDFEYVRRAHPLQDVAISLYYLSRISKKASLRKAFIDGYRDVAGWPTQWDRDVDTLIASRGLLLLNECLHSDDPHVRKFAPKTARRLRRALL